MKVFIVLLSFLMVFSQFSSVLATTSLTESEYNSEDFVPGDNEEPSVLEEQEEEVALLLAEDPEELIPLYEDAEFESLLLEVEDATEVSIIEVGAHFYFVEYVDEELEELITGYVMDQFLYSEEEAELFLQKRESLIGKDNEVVEDDSPTALKEDDLSPDMEESKMNDQLEAVETSEEETFDEIKESDEKIVEESLVETNEKSEELSLEAEENESTLEESAGQIQMFSMSARSALSVPKVQEYSGAALKNPTNVYETTSRNSKVLRSYNSGRILKFRDYHSHSDWFEATVLFEGEWKTGYIHVNDVEHGNNTTSSSVSTNQIELNGIALKSPTHVYEQTNRSSRVLRSYNQGHILRYHSHTTEWYIATVILNGVPTTGYIHVSDVETALREADQMDVQGIALNNLTHVYERASRDSNILRSYNQGHILRYRTYTSGWYIATVIINGSPRTGYIHASDVEDGLSEAAQVELQGVAQKAPTNVYQHARRESNVLRSYNQGHILRYREFSSDWYIATVIINGYSRTGYIHVSDVENGLSEEEQVELQGVAQKAPTNVYQHARRESNVLRSYNQGHILRYRTYTSDWYIATVIINGNPRTGYIHKSDVENADSEQVHLEGVGTKSPTNVYASASTSSNVLRSYSRGSRLQYRTFTSDWYQATVILNGVRHTGYIHKDDVSQSAEIYDTVNLNYTFEEMMNIQMTKTPKANGQGTILAGRNLVEYYANPANFQPGTAAYLQFLKLSAPAGADPAELNQKVLNGAGTLHGTGQAFVDAARIHNVNEIYLIAHALHETGNGTSQLARGIQHNGRTVYNFYGIRAFDGCANECGAAYAFQQGWFTPRDAIIGGAEFIASSYIARGQDTLYKMRWDPNNRGNRQYATHVSWSVLQTSRMHNTYNLISNYTHIFEVPRYLNQPAASSAAPVNHVEYPSNIVGTTTANVNFRASDTTQSESYGLVSANTRVEVLGERGNGGAAPSWLQVRINGQVGWIRSDYVNVLNLLEVTGTVVNVRNSPGTVGTRVIGTTSYLAAGVLSNNQLQKDTSTGWYHIYTDNSTGWASHTLLVERSNIIR